jgi:hypothetical protein
MDLHNTTKILNVLPPAANNNLTTTPLVCTTVDTQGFECLEFLIGLGALTDTDAVYVVLVEHGETSSGTTNLSDNVAVPDALLIGTEVQASFQFGDDLGVRKIGYKVSSGKRYVRITITPTTSANSGDSPICVLAVLANPARAATLSQADA